MTELSSLCEITGGATPAVGRIVRITQENVAVVDYPGNIAGLLEARIAVDPPSGYSDEWPPVLLAFENGDPALPIIIGFVRRGFWPPGVVVAKDFMPSPSRQALCNQRKLAFDAEEEVVFRCGKSSILLRKDGKIVIKGCRIVSRASGTNKVQGGAVRLN